MTQPVHPSQYDTVRTYVLVCLQLMQMRALISMKVHARAFDIPPIHMYVGNVVVFHLASVQCVSGHILPH